MYKCILNLYNQVHLTVMKDIVTKKSFTKAIFSIKKNPLYFRPQRNIWFEPIELGVRRFNLLTPIIKYTGHFLHFNPLIPSYTSIMCAILFFQIVYT